MKKNEIVASWLASLFLLLFCAPAFVLGDEYDHKVT
jgi:hypothetical protein